MKTPSLILLSKEKQNFNKKTYLQILFLLIINTVVYLPCIISFPDHYLDDFVVFGLINSHPNSIISLNPSDPYFLFLRPVSYFSFWIDYKLFPMQPIIMKIETLFIHLLLVVSVYFLFRELKKYFNFILNDVWIFLATLAFSLYPDNFKWITWISNRTELLMILFYALSLYTVIKYLTEGNIKISLIVYHFVFFLLSILSKQQSLHIPFLILFILWVKRKFISYDRIKLLSYFLIVEIIIVLIFTYLNSSLHQGDSLIFFDNLWKKPFAVFGNLLIIVNPYYGEIIYNYFVLNKEIAISIFIIIFISISIILFKMKKIYPFIVILSAYLIILFPRIFVASGTRLNTIQVLFVISMLVILLDIKIYLRRTIITLFILLNAVTTIKYLNIEKYFNSIYVDRINSLVNRYDRNTFVLVSKDPLMISCQYYFTVKNKYTYQSLNMAPILYSELVGPNYGENVPRVKAWRNNNEINILSLGNYFVLSISKIEAPDVTFTPLNLKTKYGKSGRGYSEISFEIPPEMKGKKLIYHDGVDWREVTQTNH